MLSAKQRRCIELMALGTLSQKEIAKEVKITEQSICAWKKDGEFMAELDVRVRASIQSIAAKALGTQAKLLHAKSEMVRYMAAKDLLDRAGYAPDNRIQLHGDSTVQIIDDIGEKDGG